MHIVKALSIDAKLFLKAEAEKRGKPLSILVSKLQACQIGEEVSRYVRHA